MAERYCPKCNRKEHHDPACSEMSFSSGQHRDDPGQPPKHSMTLEDELGKIFAGSTERMIERHVREMAKRG